MPRLSSEDPNIAGGVDIPKAQGVVLGGGEDELAVGGKGAGGDPVLVAGKATQALGGLGIPKARLQKFFPTNICQIFIHKVCVTQSVPYRL